MKDNLLDNLWLGELLGGSTLYSVAEATLPDSDPTIRTIIYTQNPCTEEQKLFLGKIIQACNLQAEEACFLYQVAAFKHLTQAFPNLHNIFLFGVPLRALQIQLQHNDMDYVELSGLRLICCIPVEKLQENAQFKTQFWNKLLKPVFVDEMPAH